MSSHFIIIVTFKDESYRNETVPLSTETEPLPPAFPHKASDGFSAGKEGVFSLAWAMFIVAPYIRYVHSAITSFYQEILVCLLPTLVLKSAEAAWVVALLITPCEVRSIDPHRYLR